MVQLPPLAFPEVYISHQHKFHYTPCMNAKLMPVCTRLDLLVATHYFLTKWTYHEDVHFPSQTTSQSSMKRETLLASNLELSAEPTPPR